MSSSSSEKNSLTIPHEKLRRGKEFVSALTNTDIQVRVTAKNAIHADIYRTTKGFSNWFEGIARVNGMKASEIDRIDLRTGKVFKRHGRVGNTNTTIGNDNRQRRRYVTGNDSRRRARTGRSARRS